MFNLGYLPGGRPERATRPETTLPAMNAALGLLAPGGLLSVVAYPGHSGGAAEAEAVTRWARALPEKCPVRFVHAAGSHTKPPPWLLLVRLQERG